MFYQKIKHRLGIFKRAWKMSQSVDFHLSLFNLCNLCNLWICVLLPPMCTQMGFKSSLKGGYEWSWLKVANADEKLLATRIWRMSQVFTLLSYLFAKGWKLQQLTFQCRCSNFPITFIHICSCGTTQSLWIKNESKITFQLGDFPFISIGSQLTVIVIWATILLKKMMDEM